MSFQPKASYLPEDVKLYRAPRPRTDLFWAFIAAMLAGVGYIQPVEPAIAEVVETVAPVDQAHQSTLIAACMNGQIWTYKDPHTGNQMGVFCDVQTLSRKM